ncbi:hypothetical protein H6F89_32665 [Cyanobacteria bacterium FACHB-63]|nr:hypothetical protein [Cyanobacteria bacterium FACHB-63]
MRRGRVSTLYGSSVYSPLDHSTDQVGLLFSQSSRSSRPASDVFETLVVFAGASIGLLIGFFLEAAYPAVSPQPMPPSQPMNTLVHIR